VRRHVCKYCFIYFKKVQRSKGGNKKRTDRDRTSIPELSCPRSKLMPTIAERPRRERHICIVWRYEHSVASENVDELLARRSCLAVALCSLTTARVNVTEKRGFSKNFKGIPDVQMWQTVPQSGIRQTQELHIVMPAGGIQLLQRLVGARLCRWLQSFSCREPLLYVFLLVKVWAGVFRRLYLVRERERERRDM
jgi:hypothetical protein